MRHPGLPDHYLIHPLTKEQLEDVGNDLLGMGLLNLTRPKNRADAICDYNQSSDYFRIIDYKTRATWLDEKRVKFTYEQWKDFMKEQWVEWTGPEYEAWNIKKGNPYKIVKEFDDRVFVDVAGREMSIMLRTFIKKVWPQAKKTIIGYKAPFDLFKGRIKKGDVFSKYSSDKFVMYTEKHMSSGVATEIVQGWEPVYEQDHKIITLGEKNRRFKISKGKMEVEVCGNNKWEEVDIKVIEDFNNLWLVTPNSQASIESVVIRGERYTDEDLFRGLCVYKEFQKI